MNGEITQPAAFEIRIANVGLVPKLDALGAAIAAVKEAHKGEMSRVSWFELGNAQDAIAAAILAAKGRPTFELPQLQ